MADDIALLVADQDLNLVFTGCGHRHEIASGDRYDRSAWPAGEPFMLPAACAEIFTAAYGPQPGNASLSPDGRAGRVAGLRRL